MSKIDKHTLKDNEVDHFIVKAREFVQENPRQIIIPIIVVVAVVAGGIFGVNYYKSQSVKGDLSLTSAQIRYQQVDNAPDRGSELLALSESEKAFKKTAQDYSGNRYGKIARVYVADNMYKAGKYDDAIKAYREAISSGAPKKGETAAWAQMSIGYCYLNKNDYKTAKTEFETLTNKYPDSFLVPSAKLQIATCLEKSNDVEKAKEIYKSVAEAYTDSSWGAEAKTRLAALGVDIAQTAKSAK